MSIPSAVFCIKAFEYQSNKEFVARCWAKFPQFVNPQFELPHLSIEIDEDGSAPIGAMCWFVNRKRRVVSAVAMNQACVPFEAEFRKIFDIFRKWDTNEPRKESVQSLQGREAAVLLPHEQQNLQKMCGLLKAKIAPAFGYLPEKAP